MKRTHIAALVLLVSGFASAHNVWIRPSSTQLSGEKDYVTIDSGASDFPFDVNHNGRPTENLHAYAPDGKEIPTSHSTGSHISNNYGSYDSVLSFKVTKAGDYRVSCEGLSDTDPVLVGPGLTFHLFHLFVWPLAAGLCSGVACWIIAVILLVRRHRALAAQTQVG